MIRYLAALAVTGVLVTFVFAGPVWREDEDGGEDAGSVPPSSQTTTGEGGLLRIAGQLGGLDAPAFDGGPSPDDFEDVYLICISDPEAFRASTFDLDAFSEFDARLYLFDMDGNGLLGNNVAPAGEPGATPDDALLVNAANDATGSEVVTTGLYLLAVTVAPRTPLSAGDPIFFFGQPDEISGPDGPGAGGALDGWNSATGACCLPDGSCIDGNTPDDCASAGGTYQNDDTSCDGITCPDPVGACCLADGACVEVTEAVCLVELEGAYEGDLSTCGDADCPQPPTGACLIIADGTSGCLITTENACAGLGGVYAGDETSCGPPPNDPCADAIPLAVGEVDFSTIGADTDGPIHPNVLDCEYVMTAHDIWYTFETPICGDLSVSTCNQASFDTVIAVYDGCDCPVTFERIVACGDDSDGCGSTTSLSGISLAPGCYTIRIAGFFEGDLGTGILTIGFAPASMSMGACCLPNGDCQDGIAPDCCVDQLGGTYQGDGSSCEGVSCPQPATGACLLALDGCVDTDEYDCADQGGDYLGDGTKCSGLSVVGGGVEPQSAAGDAWTGDGGASTALGGGGDTPEPDGEYQLVLHGVCFATEVPIGACDLPDASCIETTEFECVADDGVWQGDGTTCASGLRSMFFKKEGCPAPVNPGSNGVLKALLVGEDDFDVLDVDQSTIRLSRVDGVGGAAPPNPSPPGLEIKVKDLAAPQGFDGGCSCEGVTEADGRDDLEIPFRASDLAGILALDDLEPGSELTLALTGLLADGTAFQSRDCIVISAADPASAPLEIAANLPDILVEVSPPDDTEDAAGFTDFCRSYPPGTQVTVSASSPWPGYALAAWRRNGIIVADPGPLALVVGENGERIELVFAKRGPSVPSTPTAAGTGVR